MSTLYLIGFVLSVIILAIALIQIRKHSQLSTNNSKPKSLKVDGRTQKFSVSGEEEKLPERLQEAVDFVGDSYPAKVFASWGGKEYVRCAQDGQEFRMLFMTMMANSALHELRVECHP